MNLLPFFRPDLTHEFVAWRDGAGVSRTQFLRDAAALAASLPDAPYVLNHCEDRYRFLVGFAAALLRKQVSLFPSSRAPQVLAQLARDYHGCYCLSDQSDEPATLPVHAYRVESAAGDGGRAEPLAFPANQLAAIAFTSGSTGTPKPYTKTWGAFVHEARVAGRSLGLRVDTDCMIVATVPAQHMYGFIASIMLPIQYGYVIGAARPFYPEDIRRALAAYPHAAILVTTPVHIRACVLERVQLPPPVFVLSSTAPLVPELAAQAEAAFATRVLEFYGSTETGAIAHRRQAEDPHWRLFDDIEISVDDDGFNVKAPYFPRTISLSDRVEIHNAREFSLLGRNADLVKIAGKRISLADLNRRLLAIDGIVDGTFYLPDGDGTRESRLTAFVVAPGKTRAQLLHALKQQIDAVFLPRPLHLVAALPRNSTGKLPRGDLQRLLEQVGVE